MFCAGGEISSRIPSQTHEHSGPTSVEKKGVVDPVASSVKVLMKGAVTWSGELCFPFPGAAGKRGGTSLRRQCTNFNHVKGGGVKDSGEENVNGRPITTPLEFIDLAA
jgi:hypothetical protein